VTTRRAVVDGLARCAASGEPVVLATVVRVAGSSYGGVGARMLVRADGSTVGLVSGGCLESDLAAHARRLPATGRAEVRTYDMRADDDALWGLGLGCNGSIDVLLQPLAPAAAEAVAALLGRALAADAPGVLATVVDAPDGRPGAPAVGAQALLPAAGGPHAVGDWGAGLVLARLAADADAAHAAGRRGLTRDHDGARVAFEVVAPSVRLVVCGSGADAVPVARLGVQLGWEVTVVDHRPAVHARPDRFAGARVAECADALRLADAVPLTPRTAVVVMSHHFGRDADYLAAAAAAGVAYVGLLGPRVRTERLLAALDARGAAAPALARLFGPVGLDLGGEGPEAIALAVVAEVAAVAAGRGGGHLRDRAGPIYTPAAPAAAPPEGRPRGEPQPA
jgi:xanthine/CO dehydrogenase XdhC/CoxF family maturation factor